MKVICVGVTKDLDQEFYSSMAELKQLARACNIEVVDTLMQKLSNQNPKTYLNSGKILELKELLIEKECDGVIFNGEMTTAQFRNTQDILDVTVIDKTKLILMIFASRAKTKESLLQVAIATREYERSHLVGKNEDLYSQQGGSGFRGKGETKIEIERRLLRRQIATLKDDLKEAVKQRQPQRKRREHNAIKQVALVGYTNSGKSSLMNMLVAKSEKQVLVKDMLFATLQTSSRLVDNQPFSYILTDTVGFIKDLPTYLVKAFRSTLEEIKEADLLLMVVDLSDISYQQHITTTLEVLQDLGCQDIPILYVYNKADLVDKEAYPLSDDSIVISCKENYQISELYELIAERLFVLKKVRLSIPYELFTTVDKLRKEEQIINYQEKDEGVELIANIQVRNLTNYQKFIF